jgi:hypothetical protein
MDSSLLERYAKSEVIPAGRFRTNHGRITQQPPGGLITSDLFRRALRRFAAFLWMMPRLAALSIAEIIARTLLASGCDPALEIPFCIFRKRVRTLRLRRERTVV